MKSITITINTENAAFDPDPAREIVRILIALTYKLQDGDYHWDGEEFTFDPLYDLNGNKVGTVEVTE